MALKTVLDNFAKAQKEYEEKSKTLGVEAQKEIASAIAAVLPKGHVFGWTENRHGLRKPQDRQCQMVVGNNPW